MGVREGKAREAARRPNGRAASPRCSRAAGALLLALGALTDARRLRVLPAELGEGGAGLVARAERVEGDTELEHRVRRLVRARVLGRDLEELLRRLARAAALEVALAQPIDRVRHEPVA